MNNDKFQFPQIAKWIVSLLIAGGIFFLIWYFRFIVICIFIALVAAFMGAPIQNFLSKIRIRTFGIGKTLSASITLILLFGIFVSLFYFLVPLIISQAMTFADIDVSQIAAYYAEPIKQAEAFLYKYQMISPDTDLQTLVSAKIYATFNTFNLPNMANSLIGFADNDLVHPSVTYYENEKKNPIASKITDTAKGTLQTSINEEFVNVAVSTVMESMNELADDAQKTQYITKIIDKLDSVNKNLDDYLVTIDNLMSCNATLASNLKTASGEVSSTSGKLNNGVAQVNKAKTDAQQTITTLQSQMDQVYQSIHTHLQEVEQKQTELKEEKKP